MIVQRIGFGAVSDVMAEITAQTLMQRDVMSLMFVTAPMRAIPVLTFVLCESCTSIPSSLRALRSFVCWSMTSDKFRCGRNADGSTALASLWAWVIPFVVRLPRRRCDAIAFETCVIDISLDRMSCASWSRTRVNVILNRSDRATALPERGLSKTDCIPSAGAAKATSVTLADSMSTLPRRQRSINLAAPFIASASCPTSPGCWMVSVL